MKISESQWILLYLVLPLSPIRAEGAESEETASHFPSHSSPRGIRHWPPGATRPNYLSKSGPSLDMEYSTSLASPVTPCTPTGTEYRTGSCQQECQIFPSVEPGCTLMDQITATPPREIVIMIPRVKTTKLLALWDTCRSFLELRSGAPKTNTRSQLPPQNTIYSVVQNLRFRSF